MKEKVITTIGSWQTTLILLIIYAILIGIATGIEKYYGTSAASNIYHHPMVGILWILLIANWLIRTFRNRIPVKRRLGYYLLHISFIFLIGGALFSHYTSVEGILHVREGEQTNVIYTDQKEKVLLPFQVYLNDFQLLRYPGSASPRSYKSIVTIYEKNTYSKMEIYMNKVISIQNYRLFQTAYDEDEAGTILTVSYDPIGMTVTYIGYILLFMGILWLPFQRQSRIRLLFSKIKSLSMLLLFLPCSVIQAQTDWSRILVQNPNGRIEPLDTYCRTLVRKIHHSETVDSLNATSFIWDLLIKPDYWNKRSIIYQPNKDIRKILKQEGDYVCFNDLFDTEGNYLLKDKIENTYNVPSQRHSKLQKDLLKLDERINILLSLEQGKMLPIFPLPNDEKQRWFSPGDSLTEFVGEDSLFVSHIIPWYFSEPKQDIINMISVYQQKKTNCPLLTDTQLKMELLYNQIHPFYISAFGYISGGIFLLLSIILQMVYQKQKSFQRLTHHTITIIIICFFLLQTGGLIIRWYISGQAPWSNAYESMIYVAWCTLGGGIIFCRRSLITLSLGAIFSGIILFVAHMNQMDPAITPLVPVLQSYWLMIHVAVIMGGYGFLAISFLLGITGLSLMAVPYPTPIITREIKKIAYINELSQLIGLCLMAAGTFLGAIWANEAWGRYWGWDPKETWALITILIYTAIVHTRFIPKLNNDFVLHVLSVFGFATVLMTYLGVNYYLTGMHSYGSGNVPISSYILVIVFLSIIILSIVAFRRFYIHFKHIEK